MIKTFLLLLAMTSSGIAADPSTSMTRDVNLPMTFEMDHHRLTLKPVDIYHLSETDLQTYIDHFSSWSNLESMVGTGLALILKPLCWTLPNGAINELIIQARELENTPETVCPQYTWFILDAHHQDKYIGFLNMNFYSGSIPQKDLKSYYYNLGLKLIPEYQKKGIASTFAPIFINHLKTQKWMTGNKALIRTRTDHPSTNKITKRFDFVQYLGTKEEEINFGFFKSAVLMNFYAIDIHP